MTASQSQESTPEPRVGEPGRRDQVTVFLKNLVTPLVVLAVAGLAFNGARPLHQFFDRYRPPYSRVELATHSEGQMLHLEELAKHPEGPPTVAFVGSSAVVNGIDPGVVEEAWRGREVPFAARNYGITVLSAYELPLIADVLLATPVTTVVYLYNTFSFGDLPHPDVTSSRWDTSEFFSNYSWRPSDLEGLDLVIRAMVGERYWAVRYRNSISTVLLDRLRGRTAPLEWPYDYPKDEPVPPWRIDVTPASPAPDVEWPRATVVAATSDRSTIGDLGFLRFAELAKKRGVEVIVLPVPESRFLAFGRAMVGRDPAVNDRRVERLAVQAGVPYLQRTEIAWLEAVDPFFRDQAHLHPRGREVFSRWLAERLVPLLRASPEPAPSA